MVIYSLDIPIWSILAAAVASLILYASDIRARWRRSWPDALRQFPYSGIGGTVTGMILFVAFVAWHGNGISGYAFAAFAVSLMTILEVTGYALYRKRIAPSPVLDVTYQPLFRTIAGSHK